MRSKTLDIEFNVSKKFTDFFQFTLRCVNFINDNLSSSDSLTKRESEVMAILVLFYRISNNPYSEAHMEAYSNLFGRDMDRNAMRGYMKKIESKGWIQIIDPDEVEDYSYVLLEILSDWEDNSRSFSVTTTFNYVNAEEG